MSMAFHPFRHLFEAQSAIMRELKEIKKIMADQTQQNSVGFADVQAAVTQIVNDNTAQNNAVANQIKEVQQLIQDFAAKSQGGDGGPSQADFQGVIAQLQAVHSLVQQNTASIQASATAVTEADPNAAGTQDPTPAPEPTPTPGTPETPVAGQVTPTGLDEGTTTSSSGVGDGAHGLE
jgi:DNA-binding transcriptional MerR regulator